MSYATWIDALPTHLKTQEEKLQLLRQRFLPEPTITVAVLYGHLKLEMAMMKTQAQIGVLRAKYEADFR